MAIAFACVEKDEEMIKTNSTNKVGYLEIKLQETKGTSQSSVNKETIA